MLLGMNNRGTPLRMGSAADIDQAKAELLAGWQSWLRWAHLVEPCSAA